MADKGTLTWAIQELKTEIARRENRISAGLPATVKPENYQRALDGARNSLEIAMRLHSQGQRIKAQGIVLTAEESEFVAKYELVSFD